MWSTTVARVRCLGSPGGYCAAQARQNGSRRSCAGRRSSVQMGKLYQPWYSADTRRGALWGLCLGQYPSRVRAPHPGCRHGRSGFKAMGYHLQAKQKAPKPRHPTVRVVIGSGAGLLGRWLRRIDIHKTLLSATLALAGQVSGGGVRPKLQELSFAAHWTDHPSVSYDKFTTTHVRLQTFFPPFPRK